MTRKQLAILVGIVGCLTAFLNLMLLNVMGSVVADARTENILGPGIDVFLRTPFPTEGATVMLDVEARGGSLAGVEQIRISIGGVPLAQVQGKGVTWRGTISGGRTRGHDTETVEFKLPSHIKAGVTLPVEIDVDYVLAMRSGWSYRNENRQGRVHLDITIYTPSGRRWSQVARIALAFGYFAVWFMLVWGIAKLYAKAANNSVDTDVAELEAIALIAGFMGCSIVGYWLFACRITDTLGLLSWMWTALLMAIWCLAPLAFVWAWWKRRKRLSESWPDWTTRRSYRQ
jgi:hypothetical protein